MEFAHKSAVPWLTQAASGTEIKWRDLDRYLNHCQALFWKYYLDIKSFEHITINVTLMVLRGSLLFLLYYYNNKNNIIMTMIIIIIILFCLSWEVVTSWRSQMVLQMHVFHVWAAILEIEDIKLCTRVDTRPGSSMLIFWDVNSIWKLEGGISAQGKREATEGEN